MFECACEEEAGGGASEVGVCVLVWACGWWGDEVDRLGLGG